MKHVKCPTCGHEIGGVEPIGKQTVKCQRCNTKFEIGTSMPKPAETDGDKGSLTESLRFISILFALVGLGCLGVGVLQLMNDAGPTAFLYSAMPFAGSVVMAILVTLRDIRDELRRRYSDRR